MRSILFDMDGVLYEGERAIAGAAEAVAWVRQRNIPHLFLTNTTSRPRTALVEKLAGLGIHIAVEEILTPPVAAARWLGEHVQRSIVLFVSEPTVVEFAGLPIVSPDDAERGVDAVVVGDLGEGWNFQTLNRAFRLLLQEPRPRLVALGLTRYWRAGDGLRLDTGPYVKALEFAAGTEAIVLGKPARPFFETALEVLGSSASDTLMIGDDVRTDVEAAQRAGMRGALVKTGKFQPADLSSDVRPDAVLESVAELPRWWQLDNS